MPATPRQPASMPVPAPSFPRLASGDSTPAPTPPRARARQGGDKRPASQSPRPAPRADAPTAKERAYAALLAQRPPRSFPLRPRSSGYWVARVPGRGRVEFGSRGCRWQDALDDFNRRFADLTAGRTPKPDTSGATVGEVCNQFLAAKRAACESGALSPASFSRCVTVSRLIVGEFGKHRSVDDLTASDFTAFRATIGKGRGLHWTAGVVKITRGIFRWAEQSGLIDRSPRYGPEFVKPPAREFRRARAEKRQTFDADEITKLLAVASPRARAMVLLGMNGALGNDDLSRLRRRHLDFKTGTLALERGKTGTMRSIPLWPETIASIKDAMDERSDAADPADSDRVFLRPDGRPLVLRSGADEKLLTGQKIASTSDHVCFVFTRLCMLAGVERDGRGFYALRRTCATVADGAGDRAAVSCLLGHIDGSQTAEYIATIDPKRIARVVEHVRSWLFPKAAQKRATKSRAKG